MSIELKVPSFGESITEAYLGEWLKAEGDQVQQDEPIVVIETDKVTAELPAPVSGTITKVLKKQGDTASIGEVIGLMTEEAVAVSETVDRPGSAASASTAKPEAAPPASGDVRVMPAAARLLHERGLEPTDVTATGPGGRLLKEDVLAHPEGDPAPVASPPGATIPDAPATPDPTPAPPSPPSAPGAPSTPTMPVSPPSPAAESSRGEEVVPMSRLRLRIAERLLESQRTTAALTTFNEADLTAVKALRAEHQDAFRKKYGVKLGFMSFFVKAAVDALRLVPRVNASIDGTNLVYHNYCDIGIAVGGGRGLVVPVIRNAERLGFAEIETTIADFAARAGDNKLELHELQGGTFTISNGGIYGSMLSTPILNPPQSGILGLHAIQDRVVPVGGEPVVRPMMYLALSYDHRLVDGREAVTFLKRIKECIEDPTRMILEI